MLERTYELQAALVRGLQALNWALEWASSNCNCLQPDGRAAAVAEDSFVSEIASKGNRRTLLPCLQSSELAL
eukprot:scaffold678399_cov43-Prasinocladus_malaysianus.AAC.1